jgi:hypothetical protein
LVKFTTKYDDVEKSTITKVDAKTNKTVEITSIIDAKIDPTIKSSTEVLEFPDYDTKGFENIGLKILDVNAYKKQMKKLFEKPSTDHPVQPWNKITCQSTAKVGETIKIKFSKTVKDAVINIGDHVDYNRLNRYDPKSEFDLILNPAKTIEYKDINKKQIELEVGEVYNKKQTWGAGNYLLDIVCQGNEGAEQTHYMRVIKLHG